MELTTAIGVLMDSVINAEIDSDGSCLKPVIATYRVGMTLAGAKSKTVIVNEMTMMTWTPIEINRRTRRTKKSLREWYWSGERP